MPDLSDELKRLIPTAVDRDALMVAMAKASVPRRSAAWPWICLALVLSQMTMGVLWWRSTRSPPIPTMIDPVPTPNPSRELEPIEPYSYFALRLGEITPSFTNEPVQHQSLEAPILRVGQRSMDGTP